MISFRATLTIVSALLFTFLVAVPTFAQTDIALSLYGAFSGATNGNGVQESPSNSAGGVRDPPPFKSARRMGSTYSYNRANQTYSPSPAALYPAR